MENKIGFGTIGYGMIAQTHLIAMQGNRVQHPHDAIAYPRALCTRRPDENRDLPYEVLYTDERQLVYDEGVQVVDVCTPNNLHAKAGLVALEAGKAVYMEKPLAHTLADARSLSDAAQVSGLPNQAALTMRFHTAVNRMKDQLAAGAIGNVIHFRCCFYHGSYLDPNRPTSWRQQSAMSGGGAVIDLGIHMLDFMRYLLGEAVSVQAAGRTVFKTRFTDDTRLTRVPNDTDEYLCAMLRLKSGAIGIVESSRVSESARNNVCFEIFGSCGSLLFEGGNVFLVKAGGNGPMRLNGSMAGPCEHEVSALRPQARQSMGSFVDAHAAAIKNICNWHQGKPFFSGTPTFEEAYRAQVLADACLRAAVSGIAVDIEKAL